MDLSAFKVDVRYVNLVIFLMQNYVPLFGQVVDSSLWEEPLHVRVLFVTMLAIKDWDHVVRVKRHHLRRKANITEKELENGLKVLESPDERALGQEHAGRRIRGVEDGWLILNGEVYQRLMQEVNKRARWARQKRIQRARKAGKPLPGEVGYVKAMENGEPEEVLDRLCEPRGGME